MKKLMSLLLSVVFVGSLMVVMSGCAPKEEAAAPVVDNAATMGNTEGAQAVPGAEQAAPAAGEEAAPAE